MGDIPQTIAVRARVITLISTGTIKFYELLNCPKAPFTHRLECLRLPIKKKWVASGELCHLLSIVFNQ